MTNGLKLSIEKFFSIALVLPVRSLISCSSRLYIL